METEADVEYSEIIELPSLSPTHQGKVMISPSHSESQFDTYICMDGDKIEELPPPAEEPHTSRQGQRSTFRRFSTIEAPEVIHYENSLHNFPNSHTFASTEDILPRFRNSSGGDVGVPDDVLSLRTRLRIKKRMLSFLPYACYAMEAVFEEVEKIQFLNIVFFIIAVGVATLGILRIDSCTFSPRIPVMMIVSGALDMFLNSTSIFSAVTKKRPIMECLQDITRIGRATLFFIHMYGLAKVYGILPPEEVDPNSLEYCDSFVFWIAFSFFHIATFSSLAVLSGMLIAVACFYS